jgi:rhamnogalacturonan endolyase
MLSRFFAPLLPVLVLWSSSQVGRVAAAGEPFLKEIDSKTHVIGNDLWNLTVGEYFGTKLWYKGYDLVGNASGHYVSYSKTSQSVLTSSTTLRLRKQMGQRTI